MPKKKARALGLDLRAGGVGQLSSPSAVEAAA